MNATTDLERSLATWLEREGPDDVSERVVEAALAEARTVHQRPAWLTATWWASVASREGEAMRPTQTIERVPTIPVARPSLRLGWIVVAIAALLALLGGLLVVGALQDRDAPLLSECPAGTTPNDPGPIDQVRPAGDAVMATWTGDRGIVVALLQRGVWQFDVCSNTWLELSDEEVLDEVFGAGYGFRSPALAYDVDSDALVAIERNVVWTSDTDGVTWKRAGETPFSGRLKDPRAVYDPVSGLIVVLDRRFMWTYDVETDAWTEIDQGEVLPPNLGYEGYALVAYDAAVDRIVLYRLVSDSRVGSSVSTWEFDLRARTWGRSKADTPRVNFGWWAMTGLVYDEAHERSVVFGDAFVTAYDAAADHWEIVYGEERGEEPGFVDSARFGPLARIGHTLAYDPLNHRLIAFGGQYRSADPETGEFLDWEPTDDVMALDLVTGTWTELLAPSE